jgi:excisionase family DNA binding protein
MTSEIGLGGFFTLSELSELLGVRRDTLKDYVEKGRLVGRKRGQTLFFTLEAVEAAKVRVPFKAAYLRN